MDSSVLLRTEDLYPLESSREPIEIAALASSLLVFLGGPRSIARRLIAIIAGEESPVSGRVLVGEDLLDVRSREGRRLVRFVAEPLGCAGDLTVAGHLGLSAAAAGLDRRESLEITGQISGWCGLDELMETPLRELDPDDRYILGFASACLPVPKVMVLQGPLPTRMHGLLSDVCADGCSVVVSVPGIDQVPRSAERIAICSSTGIPAVLRFQELTDACTALSRISVRFFPALPRPVMESLSGARDFLAIEGGYSFHHGNLSMAVTNLVSLARANSRTIVGLQMVPPLLEELLEHLIPTDDEHEADLFCSENLST